MAQDDAPQVDREKLTFAQAEGRAPLPRQLKLGELPPAVTSLLWALVHESVTASVRSTYDGYQYIDEPWVSIMRAHHLYHQHRFVDEFTNSATKQLAEMKKMVTSGGYADCLDFIQYVMRHSRCPSGFSSTVESILSFRQAAYRVENGRTFYPIASAAEAETVQRAFEDLAGTKFAGAGTHLAQAGAELTVRNYASSIRESISAIEAIARVLAPKANTLGPALAKLETSRRLHPALRQGFDKLYGFTCDEEGIRHALLEKAAADVDETDALYMFGACAAFASYLIRRSGEVVSGS